MYYIDHDKWAYVGVMSYKTFCHVIGDPVGPPPPHLPANPAPTRQQTQHPTGQQTRQPSDHLATPCLALQLRLSGAVVTNPPPRPQASAVAQWGDPVRAPLPCPPPPPRSPGTSHTSPGAPTLGLGRAWHGTRPARLAAVHPSHESNLETRIAAQIESQIMHPSARQPGAALAKHGIRTDEAARYV